MPPRPPTRRVPLWHLPAYALAVVTLVLSLLALYGRLHG